MKILVVTDHVFLRFNGNVYDNFCFDQEFFDDYRQTFSNVLVAARMIECENLPADFRLSSGDSVEFVSMGSYRGWRWFVFAAVTARRKLRAAVLESDAVVLRVPSALAWVASRLALRARKPYIIEVIGDPEEAYQAAGQGPLFKLLGKWAKQRLKMIARGASAASYVNSSTLPAKYPVSKSAPVRFISSIRMPRRQILPARRHADPIPNPSIVYVGTLTRRKRVSDLLCGCAVARDQGVDIQLHIVGSGPEEESLRAESEALGLLGRVEFHGQLVGINRINEILDKSDLFVLPSMSEGLPRSIIEAMARGLPAIGSDAQGVRDLIRPEDAFAVGDITDLGRLIVESARDPERLNRMSAHSHSVANLYSQEVLGPLRQSLYGHIAESVRAS
ncbi:RfaG Glycosyltransferase [Sphingomonadaceae bacterium]